MDHSVESQEFALPLELQFSMRKAELQAQDMTWEQLYAALLNLYYQRLMEWHAVKTLLADENIQIEIDLPTELELCNLAAACAQDDDEDDEDDNILQPF
jgi:hypothetical protein